MVNKVDLACVSLRMRALCLYNFRVVVFSCSLCFLWLYKPAPESQKSDLPKTKGGCQTFEENFI